MNLKKLLHHLLSQEIVACCRCLEISARIMLGPVSKNPGQWLSRTLSWKGAAHSRSQSSRRLVASTLKLKPGTLEEPVSYQGRVTP